jgi:tRNA dimethylallyltransferase
MQKLIVITGPTASGKSALALGFALATNAEIISADSRQLFSHLDIGTAKPSKDELESVPHHFIGIKSPQEHYSAGIFEKDAREVRQDILNRNKKAILVGGSGLYVKAFCDGLFQEDEVSTQRNNNIREKLNLRFETEGIEKLYNELEKCDPLSHQKYSDKNRVRVIRALEYFLINGRAISEAHQESKAHARDFEPIYFGLEFSRQDLYERINKRTLQMWEDGIVQETKDVLAMGYSKDLNSLNTVGYKEVISYLEGNLTKDEAISLIGQNTRRYAKRQITWCRNQIPQMNWLSGSMEENISEIIKKAEIK